MKSWKLLPVIASLLLVANSSFAAPQRNLGGPATGLFYIFNTIPTTAARAVSQLMQSCKGYKLDVGLPNYCAASGTVSTKPGDGGWLDVTFTDVETSICGGAANAKIIMRARISSTSAAEIVAYNTKNIALQNAFFNVISDNTTCSLELTVSAVIGGSDILVKCGDLYFDQSKGGVYASTGDLATADSTLLKTASLVCLN